MTPDTLNLIRDVLGQVQLSVGHPDFAEQAPRFVKARAEVEAALSEAVTSDE